MQLRSLSPFKGISPACLGVSLPTITIALLSVMVAGCDHSILFTATAAPSGESMSAEENPDPVSEAVAQATAAANLTQTASTWEEWHRVAQHWQEAIARLETVSREHYHWDFAQQRIPDYQKNLTYARQQFDRLDPLKPALNKGGRASQLTRVAVDKRDWTEGVQAWQDAIAQLQIIPPTYPNSSLLQQKRVEYERNLTFSQQQLLQFHPFYQGMAKAEEAKKRAETASNMEQWESVALLWKQAIALLASISPDDDKATLATPKIHEYESHLTQVHQHIAQLDPYNRAVAQVENARKLQKTAHSMGEWEAVRGEWLQAIAHLKTVPPNHAKIALAEQLLAESQVNLAGAGQQVRQTDPFNRAVATAETASQLTQSAFSLYDWNAIASQWQEAIALLQSVPPTHSQHPLVAQKITAYQTALDQAIQQSHQWLQPFPPTEPPSNSHAKTPG
jgi:tetratricopeptide (TPR) repeat protein